MKVFRISGRDSAAMLPARGSWRCLNESLPHKRKRLGTLPTWSVTTADRLNESLPHKRKRLVMQGNGKSAGVAPQ